ncbi:hypothetical protein B9Z55_017939 [Caenorhabditis nigoni]|nr:hypothetical protein B9Z55_017939 [Caenorhabditis nigoni]
MYNFLDIPTTVVDGIFAKGFCKNETICTSPSKNCTWILGNITVTTDSDLENMKSVEAVFGGITISGTNITDFSFLENLKYAASFRRSAILIENNQKLTNVTFPKLKRVNLDSSYALDFENNNPILTLNSSYCFGVRKSLGFEFYLPIFDNWTCEGLDINHDYIVQNQKKKSGYQTSIGAFFIILIMFFV